MDREQLSDRRAVLFQDALFELVAEEDAHQAKENLFAINFVCLIIDLFSLPRFKLQRSLISLIFTHSSAELLDLCRKR